MSGSTLGGCCCGGGGASCPCTNVTLPCNGLIYSYTVGNLPLPGPFLFGQGITNDNRHANGDWTAELLPVSAGSGPTGVSDTDHWESPIYDRPYDPGQTYKGWCFTLTPEADPYGIQGTNCRLEIWWEYESPGFWLPDTGPRTYVWNRGGRIFYPYESTYRWSGNGFGAQYYRWAMDWVSTSPVLMNVIQTYLPSGNDEDRGSVHE